MIISYARLDDDNRILVRNGFEYEAIKNPVLMLTADEYKRNFDDYLPNEVSAEVVHDASKTYLYVESSELGVPGALVDTVFFPNALISFVNENGGFEGDNVLHDFLASVGISALFRGSSEVEPVVRMSLLWFCHMAISLLIQCVVVANLDDELVGNTRENIQMFLDVLESRGALFPEGAVLAGRLYGDLIREGLSS